MTREKRVGVGVRREEKRREGLERCGKKRGEVGIREERWKEQKWRGGERWKWVRKGKKERGEEQDMTWRGREAVGREGGSEWRKGGSVEERERWSEARRSPREMTT